MKKDVIMLKVKIDATPIPSGQSDGGINPDFADVLNQADEIATSGRWDALNARIRKLAINPGADSDWWVQLIGSLCSQNFSEYRSLKRAYENKHSDDAPVLAWRARNLLELAVWSRYCAKGRENARRLNEDAGRDTRELYDKMLAFGKAGLFTGETLSDWPEPFENAKRALYERARSEGIDSLDGKYLNVSSAAEECDIAEQFGLINKMLSKFAHPTALRIMAPPDQQREELQRTYFFRYGCLFFIGAFHSLEGLLDAQRN
jgi:hypothetical protein